MFHKKFLTNIKNIFDSVSYSVQDANFDFEDYKKACMRALRCSDSLKEAQQMLRDIKYVRYFSDSISRKIKKHYDFYCSLDDRRKEISSKENEAAITITNDLSDDLNNSICLASFLDDEILEIINIDGVYRMNDDSYSYYIKHVDDDEDIRVVIYDKGENPICTVYMDDEVDIYLEDNKTNMFLQKQEDGIAIFSTECVKKSNNKPALEDMTAFLDWNLVEVGFKGCVARLNLFKTDIKLELLLLLSVSTLLLE